MMSEEACGECNHTAVEGDCCCTTGQIVAIYNEQEGEVEVGPCMLGATTLMAPAHRAFACLPCGYRTLNSCMLWEVPLQELLPVRIAPGCTLPRISVDLHFRERRPGTSFLACSGAGLLTL